MATATTYTATGTKATKNTTLPKAVFGIDPVSHDLIHQAYTVVHANQRSRSAHSKTRTEVRGGGRKPWRQKGTGNARAGSRRSPLWRGGGVIFGPDGSQTRRRQLNKTAKRAAVCHGLSLRAQEGAVAVIEEIKPDGTTKSARAVVDKLPAEGTLLLVPEAVSPEADRSLRNIQGVELVDADSLNIMDILHADTIIITKKGLQALSNRLEETS